MIGDCGNAVCTECPGEMPLVGPHREACSGNLALEPAADCGRDIGI